MSERDYVTDLGYTRAPIHAKGTGVIPGVRCNACGAEFPSVAGDVMRGHRRRCPGAPDDPYTPAVCDS